MVLFFWNYNFFWNHNFLVASAARHGSFLNYFFRIGIYTSFCFGITILFVASAASYGSLFLTIVFLEWLPMFCNGKKQNTSASKWKALPFKPLLFAWCRARCLSEAFVTQQSHGADDRLKAEVASHRGKKRQAGSHRLTDGRAPCAVCWAQGLLDWYVCLHFPASS